ncbi:MAG: beta-N-acetylglucosaminidase domain-containing protein [Alphaproteobacteria bacterium]|nr:beta-N-acetylglucosaminidase domain-containing protein [Alphaproteobacteria bacterium]
MKPELGIIEGYFGRPWSFADRTAVMQTLGAHGYSFFHYAPKGDEFLRRRWREAHPAAMWEELRIFAAACRAAGVRFGVGLSPYEVFNNFDDEARTALRARVTTLETLGLDDLAILFDDMRGDIEDLAQRQASIMEFVAGCTGVSRLIMCPSYYTDDCILDRVFGNRPQNYLEQLGKLLDPAIQIFWTGEEVCSRDFSPGHLQHVAQRLRRKPFLWDNYPVNDGPRMSRFLHLRGFTGRPAVIAPHIAAHAINPALQPHLSSIPALTLADSYAQGDRYSYMIAFRKAARAIVGEKLSQMLEADLLAFQDSGLDHLGTRAAKLRARWSAHDHPAAKEIVAWLDGAYAITGEEMQTQ